jgi:rhodanese-related sulfurtransferase
MLEVTPQEAKLRLSGDPQVLLVDVREDEEFAAARIEGAHLIPMQSVPTQLRLLQRLAEDHDLLVICHHGVRSLNVVEWLRANGLKNCFSLAGGIDRWSREIDPSIPRY